MPFRSDTVRCAATSGAARSVRNATGARPLMGPRAEGVAGLQQHRRAGSLEDIALALPKDNWS